MPQLSDVFACNDPACPHCPIRISYTRDAAKGTAELLAQREAELYAGRRQDFWNKPGWFTQKGK